MLEHACMYSIIHSRAAARLLLDIQDRFYNKVVLYTSMQRLVKHVEGQSHQKFSYIPTIAALQRLGIA